MNDEITNSNEYDDDGWAQYSVETSMAIAGFWAAGASIQDIAEVIENGLEDAGASVTVDLTLIEKLPDTTKRTPKPTRKKAS